MCSQLQTVSGQAPQWTSGAILLQGLVGKSSSGFDSCQLESQGHVQHKDGSAPHVRKMPFHVTPREYSLLRAPHLQSTSLLLKFSWWTQNSRGRSSLILRTMQPPPWDSGFPPSPCADEAFALELRWEHQIRVNHLPMREGKGV